ncbi:MAG TPA: HPP family protein [Phycisphaerae bacterium]|nr:HPP family protein [Phycisphaerae bacterium]
MGFVDEKFRANKARYIFQCGLATASVLAVLLVLDAFSNAAVIASLGASSFVAFTMPRSDVSRPRFLVGGYVVGVAAGSLCYWLSLLAWPGPLIPKHSYILFGALAVGLAIFAMVVTNTEHPPAAGVALGLVLGEWHGLTVVVILVGIVALSAVKRLLRPVLIDLL